MSVFIICVIHIIWCVEGVTAMQMNMVVGLLYRPGYQRRRALSSVVVFFLGGGGGQVCQYYVCTESIKHH